MPFVRSPRQNDAESHQPMDSLALNDLLALLRGGDAEKRRDALHELARRPESAPALCRMLGTETDAALREVLAVVISQLGGAAAVDELLPLLRSDDATLRNSVIDILKEFPNEIAPRMEALLDDPDPNVRIFVVNVLQGLRHPNVEAWLIAVISIDTNVNVVATALDLLAESGTQAAVPALTRTATRFPHEPFIAFAVTNALKQIQCEGR